MPIHKCHLYNYTKMIHGLALASAPSVVTFCLITLLILVGQIRKKVESALLKYIHATNELLLTLLLTSTRLLLNFLAMLLNFLRVINMVYTPSKEAPSLAEPE